MEQSPLLMGVKHSSTYGGLSAEESDWHRYQQVRIT